MLKDKIYSTSYSLFLLSGVIKVFLSVNNLKLPIDLTLLLGSLLIAQLVFNKKLNSRLNFIFNNGKIKTSLFLFTIFYCWILISNSWSPSSNYSITKSLNILTLSIALIWPILSNRYSEKYFKNSFSIIAAITGIWFVFFILPFIYVNPNYYEIQSTYLNIAVNSGLGIILLFTQNHSSYIKWLKLSLLFALFVSLILSGGRSAIITTIGILTIWRWLAIINKRNYEIGIRKIRLIILGVVVIFSISTFGFSEKIDDLLSRSSQRISLLGNVFSDKDAGNSVNHRMDLLQFSINHINSSNSQLFFGSGNGSFGILYDGKDQRNYPHNILVEIVFEYGFIGLLIFLAFIFNSTKGILRTAYVWPIIFMFFQAMKSNELGDQRILFATIALFLYSKVQPNSPHQIIKTNHL